MVFIILPAHNEEKNIGRVIRGLVYNTDYADVGEDYADMKIVVIDDGSMDKTGEIARQEGATVIRHEINRGQGAALQTGDEYALAQGAETIVHFDADGQFNPADIVPALKLIQEGKADVVFGSRFLDGRTKMPRIKRRIILPISRWINFVFTGVWLTDAHNGFRVLNRAAAEKINITQDRMAHNSEIVAQIKKNNFRFVEIPVEVVYHEYGQGVSGGVRILIDLLLGKFWVR